MDNRCTRRDGRYYQLGGAFVWWPIDVNRGKPWPKEVPILGPENFERDWDNPDTRSIYQWVRGFSPDTKMDKVVEAIKQAAKEFSIPGFGGSYVLELWGYKQTPQTLSKIWNRAMEILGYTEEVE